MDWREHIGKRYTFTAEFERAGPRWMLLKDVRRADGELFRDHLFLPFTARFKAMRLREGDVVRLRGKVNRYYKKAPGDQALPRYLAELIPDLEITNISSVRKE